MKNIFNTWLNMLRSVLALADLQPAIVNSLVAFKDSMSTLGGKVLSIESSGSLVLLQITGSASEKKAMRLYLCEYTYSIISRVRAHAQLTGNDVLREQMRYTLSSLKRMKSADLLLICNQLHALVLPLVPSLVAYNITATDMTLWSTAIQNYNGVLNAPKMSIVKRKQLNESLTKMFNDTLEYVREVCDPTATYFKENANEFFLQYQSARKLDATGIHHTRLLSVCKTELGDVISGVIITLKGRSAKSFTYTGMSDFYGNCIISGINEDELGYDLIVSGNAVVEQTFGPFLFARGKSRNEALVCQPKFANLPQPQPEPVPQPA